MDLEVKHDTTNQKFYTVVEGKEAYLQYIVINTNTINMIKTYVPNELRGRGIAGKIVEEGLKYAKRNFYSVIPSCSYVEDYINKHEEYENIRLYKY